VEKGQIIKLQEQEANQPDLELIFC